MRELPEHVASIICACAKRVGVETAQALAVAAMAVEQMTAQLGGERHYWPRVDRDRERRERDAHVRALAAQGLTHDEIGTRVGITRQRVSQILAG